MRVNECIIFIQRFKLKFFSVSLTHFVFSFVKWKNNCFFFRLSSYQISMFNAWSFEYKLRQAANNCDAKWIEVYYVTELRTLIFRLVWLLLRPTLAIREKFKVSLCIEAEFESESWIRLNGSVEPPYTHTHTIFLVAFNLLHHVYMLVVWVCMCVRVRACVLYQWCKIIYGIAYIYYILLLFKKSFAHLNICFWLNAV